MTDEKEDEFDLSDDVGVRDDFAPRVRVAHLHFQRRLLKELEGKPFPEEGKVTLRAFPQNPFKMTGIHAVGAMRAVELVSIVSRGPGGAVLWPEVADPGPFPIEDLMGLTFNAPSVMVGGAIEMTVRIEPPLADLFFTLIGKPVE